jgi:hypothetical protein
MSPIRCLPARHQQELAEGAGGADDGERHGALVRRDGAADGAVDHREGGGGQAQPDQHAGGEGEHEGRRRVRHQADAGGVEQAAAEDHLAGAEAVGQPAGDRPAGAPHQVLQGDGEGEGLAAPGQILRHRLQEQAEGVADAERERDDDAAAEQDQGGGARRDGGIHWRVQSLNLEHANIHPAPGE